MIKLSHDQTLQMINNLEKAMDDLRTAAFDTDDSTPLLSTGANIGLALQKLYDVRLFLSEQVVQAEMKAESYVPCESTDPWETTADSNFKRLLKKHKAAGL